MHGGNRGGPPLSLDPPIDRVGRVVLRECLQEDSGRVALSGFSDAVARAGCGVGVVTVWVLLWRRRSAGRDQPVGVGKARRAASRSWNGCRHGQLSGPRRVGVPAWLTRIIFLGRGGGTRPRDASDSNSLVWATLARRGQACTLPKDLRTSPRSQLDISSGARAPGAALEGRLASPPISTSYAPGAEA
jgi:hypothetical protein